MVNQSRRIPIARVSACSRAQIMPESRNLLDVRKIAGAVFLIAAIKRHLPVRREHGQTML
jgi:hypothetical protein